MKKKAAITMFETARRLAGKMGISTQAISHWPDELTLAISDRVRGAALRCGYSPKWIKSLDPKAPTMEDIQ